MVKLLQMIRYSALGVFFSGIIVVLQGCGEREGVLGIALLVLLQFCSGPVAEEVISSLPAPCPNQLVVLDDDSNSVLCISLGGTVSVLASSSAVFNATGVTPDFTGDNAVAIGSDGAIYVTSLPNIFKIAPGNVISLLTSAAAIAAVAGVGNDDPEGITFGNDGNLYVSEDDSDQLLRVNPSSGAVSLSVTTATFTAAGITVRLEEGLTGTPGGLLYIASGIGGLQQIVLVNVATSTPSVLVIAGAFSDLSDAHTTLAPNGDLIVADQGNDTIHRVTPAGVISTFISEAALEAAGCMNGEANPTGIAFDSSGNFYIANRGFRQDIYRFTPALVCSLFVSEATIIAQTLGGDFFASGIEFSP